MAVAGVDTAEHSLRSDDEFSFAFRAARLYGIGGLQIEHEPGTRADFAQALQQFGARPEVRQLMRGRTNRLGMRLHVSCSRADWEYVFGELDCIEEVVILKAKDSLYRWKHFCSDGPITFQGHLFERQPGVRWVVVVRVARL